MDSDTEDTSGGDQSDDQPLVVAETAPASTASSGGGNGGDADDDGRGDGDGDEDWEQVLAQVSRDTAMTKMLVAILLAVVVVASVVLGVLIRTGDKTTGTATATTSTTAPTSTVAALASVAGQPCVAMVDPAPAGAPSVDVVVGPAPTSLVVKDIKQGTGAEATATSTVSVNYVGVACSTGKIFDASYKGGTTTPASFPVAQVIPGFGKGVTGMKVGGQRLIGIPSDQAYGATGRGATIAPDEALWFVVELTAVTP